MSSRPDRCGTRQLNRTVLARQMLLERAGSTIPEVLEAMGGLQAQYAPSSYVGLWSRLAGFHRGDLDEALEARSVIQATLMRTTIHLVSAADYWLFAAGVRRVRREWFLRVTKPAVTYEWMAEKAAQTRELLAAGPMKRTDLVKELGLANHLWVGTGLWVDLVRVPPGGTWGHRRADLYALAEEWLEPADPSPEEGIDHLIARYLGAFGPARPADISSWSGLTGPEVEAGLGRGDLKLYEDGEGKTLYDLPGGRLADPDVPAPVRFLGSWEALLLVHARRTGVLPEHLRPRVFSTKNPQSVFTFTVDGRVAGSWRLDGGAVSIELFEELPPELLEEVRMEGERIAEVLR